MALTARFNLSLGLALAVTLGVKTLTGGGVHVPADDAIAGAIERAFAANGFRIGKRSEFGNLVFTGAAKGDCVVNVASISLEGWHEPTLRTLESAERKLSFVFRGEVYPDGVPQWTPLIWHYYKKGLTFMLDQTTYSPLYAILSSKACETIKFDWNSIEEEKYYYINSDLTNINF